MSDLTPEEKEGVRDLNRRLNEMMAPILSDLYALRDPKTGEKIEFEIKRGSLYHYFTGPHGTRFCYTPHPDTRGFYWTFEYVPKGKGARSGKARRFVLRNLTRASHHGTAIKRANARWRAAWNAHALAREAWRFRDTEIGDPRTDQYDPEWHKGTPLWRVGGIGPFSDLVGEARGYTADNYVRLELPDGRIAKFSPHELFPVPRKEGGRS
jgi:hypothetical protein